MDKISGIIEALSKSSWAVLFTGVGLIVTAVLKAKDKKTRLLIIWTGIGLSVYSLIIYTLMFIRGVV